MSSGREGLFANVTEVIVNGPDDVYVEREGWIERVRERLFEGEESVLDLMGWGGGRRGCAGTRTRERRVARGKPPAWIRESSLGCAPCRRIRRGWRVAWTLFLPLFPNLDVPEKFLGRLGHSTLNLSKELDGKSILIPEWELYPEDPLLLIFERERRAEVQRREMHPTRSGFVDGRQPRVHWRRQVH